MRKKPDDFWHPERALAEKEALSRKALRDWFAGQALVGILASRNGFMIDVGVNSAPDWAYQVADGMLAARERKKVLGDA